MRNCTLEWKTAHFVTFVTYICYTFCVMYMLIYMYIYTHTLFNIELFISTLFWWFWNVRGATLPFLPTPKNTY